MGTLGVWETLALVPIIYTIGCLVNLIIVLLVIPQSGYGMEQGFFLPFLIPLSWLAIIILLVGVFANIRWWATRQWKRRRSG